MIEALNLTEIASTAKVLTQGSSTVFLPLRGMESLTIERHFREQDVRSWEIIKERLKVQIYFELVFSKIEGTAGVQFSIQELVKFLTELDPSIGIEAMYDKYLANQQLTSP